MANHVDLTVTRSSTASSCSSTVCITASRIDGASTTHPPCSMCSISYLGIGLLLRLRVELVQDDLAEVPDTTDSVEPCPHRRVGVAADVLDGEHRLAELLLVHGGGVLRLRHTPPPAPASCSSVPTGR